MTFQIFRLIVNDPNDDLKNAHFGVTKCYDLTEIYDMKCNLEHNMGHIMAHIMVPHVCDIINDFFVHVNLPKLENNMCWQDNILLKLIKCIKIKLTDHMCFIDRGTIILDKKYIENLLTNELNDFNDALLFKNLDIHKRKELSKKEIKLILPLKLKTPIIGVTDTARFEMEFDYGDLLENGSYDMGNITDMTDITWQLQMYGQLIDIKIRDQIWMSQKY